MKLRKLFKSKNETNSSLAVTCIASERCEMRHTTLCENCENNLGMQQDKNCFKAR